MRCLQCGKDVPLLKRLTGREFCSDAHHREYQHEYSQLALGRLLQSDPAESQAPLLKAPPLVSASALTMVGSPANATDGNGAPSTAPPKIATAKPSPAFASARTAGPATARAMPAATPNKIAQSQTPVATAAKNVASQPAAAKPAVIQKPAPAELQFAPVAAPEFEPSFASLVPDKPRRQGDMSLAELPQGRAVPWENGFEIADSIPRPIEHDLELRGISRTPPKFALDLRIVPPESLKTERQALAISVAPAVPAEASLWIAPYCDFVGELVFLSDFADTQFLTPGFEVPALEAPAGIAVSSGPEPFPLASQAAAAESGTAQSTAPSPALQLPEPRLNPLPTSAAGIPPGRVKPLPVFGPVPISFGTVQIPQPNRLPLRPQIVLAAPAAPTAGLSISPSLQQSRTSSIALNPAPPELRMPDPAGAGVSRIRTILAAASGAAVLGIGILFFASRPGDAGLKSPAHALADGAASEWIANFAPDARRQRRVSLLRSSMSMQSYRLDFESSIQIKALGWVYRARDPKNFYVSKIEFQRPGVNPVYALVHYAVINGIEQPRVETLLHASVPMGGLYKIRFEAVGNRFTTWVQGQQVDQWTDPRLSSGGAGLFGEGVEQSILHGDFAVTRIVN